LVQHLLRSLHTESIHLLTGAKAVGIRGGKDKTVLTFQRSGGPAEETEADKVLVAVGRKPDLEGLRLEKAGVAFNARGIITDAKLRTSAPHIYACGDIAGPFQLASTAEAQAIVAATNAFLPVKRAADYRNNVYVIFTEPPLAWTGLTEEQAHERYGRKLKAYRFQYNTMRRALIDGNDVGMAKILCDGGGRIVGAHILGEGAGEVIHELQVIRALRTPLHKLQILTHAYPTYAQAIVGRASQLAYLDRMGNNPFVDLVLRLLPGFANRLYLSRDRLAETHPADAFAEFQGDPPSAATVTGLPTDTSLAGHRDAGKVCTVESRKAGQESSILDIRGNLTIACKKAFTRAFDEAIKSSKRILLNLSGLGHMDTEGAGLLLIGASRAARKRIAVSACGLPGPYGDVFHLTGLDRIIALYKDEEDALCCRRFLEKSGLSVSPLPADPSPPLPGWAKSVDRLSMANVPAGAMNRNVDGRRTSSPVHGFGRLWEKRYRLRLHDRDLDPKQIIAIWRSEFPDFWPKGNHLFPSGNAPIAPGTAALLNLSLPGGLILATGVMVIYADDTSFSFMTTQGHMLSGWITFSCFRDNQSTFVQVHPLFRAGDPLMELGFRLGAAAQEDRFWHETLGNLARRLGTHGEVAQHNILVDPHIQWNKVANLRHSAAIRSSLYMPVYLIKKCFAVIKSWGRNVDP
jgi:anti-anti-sigma factor